MSDDELRQVLTDRLKAVRQRIQAACQRSNRSEEDVTLVAVTKTVSPRVAGLLPDLGVVDLGESRPQELWRKAEALKHLPIRWHMIGHLQRNKVDRTLPLARVIHSIDSFRLLEAIAAESAKTGARPKVLLEVNISGEEQKHGFEAGELRSRGPVIQRLSIEVVGLMGMAAIVDDPELTRPAFKTLRKLRDELQPEWHAYGIQLTQLSMGMSGDFEMAIEEGSTLVRIGTTLFEGLESL